MMTSSFGFPDFDSVNRCVDRCVNRRVAVLAIVLALSTMILGANCQGQVKGQGNKLQELDSQAVRSRSSALISISSGPIKLSIDPAVGGRVASMTYEGDEILRTKRDENNFHWGSSVWVSPQKNWGWPPSKVIDSGPYKVVSADEQAIVLSSEVDVDTGYQITKRFEFKKTSKTSATIGKATTPVVKMTYTVHNHTKETKKVALWENTRVHWDGIVRFAAGTKIRLSSAEKSVELISGEKAMSMKLDDKQPNAQKLFCTPPVPKTGKFHWVSYRRGALVLVKSRLAPQAVAPEQAPLEIYLSPENDFAELEYQGEYVELGAREKASMVVLWKLRRVETAK